MKKLLIVLIINLLNANTVLNYINHIRNRAGLPSVKYNANLALAAKKHAIYLTLNNEYGHYESMASTGFYGYAPWDRILKAGFPVKAVVENISFFEPNYRASVNKLMGTVYHRLAFLDERIDSIGYSVYKGRYVYDMSSYKISHLCKKKYTVNTNYVYDVCKNGNIIPQYLYNKTLNSIIKRVVNRCCPSIR